jgi:hypothetical protein
MWSSFMKRQWGRIHIIDIWWRLNLECPVPVPHWVRLPRPGLLSFPIPKCIGSRCSRLANFYCARKLIAVALSGHVDVDWQEARRLADCPAYAILPELTRLVREVSHELGKRSPYDS